MLIKELVHAFSCAFIELWMHSEGLESTQEASHLICKELITRIRRRVPDFETGENLSFNQSGNKEFCVFSRES